MTTSPRAAHCAPGSAGNSDGLGDRPRAGEGQPRPVGRRPAAPTASTTSRRRTTRSRCTTSSSRPTSDELSVSVTTADGVPLDDVPQDRSNLAVAAALALAERAGVEPLVRLHITKRIPVAGGMAGGSADAAAALVACDALWQTGLSRAELLEIAAGLGSDVPFSLVGGTALGTGRGEVLTPVLARGRFEWVVAIADGRPLDPGGVRRVRPAARRPGAARAAGARQPDGGPAHRRRDRARGRAAQRPAGGGVLAAAGAAADAGDRRGGRGARRHRVRQRSERRVPGARARSTRSTSRSRSVPPAPAGRYAGRTARSPAPGCSARPEWPATSSTSRTSARPTAPASCSTASRSASPRATAPASSAATATASRRCCGC